MCHPSSLSSLSNLLERPYRPVSAFSVIVRARMNFDFDSQTRRKLGYQLIEVVDRFFASLADRPVQPAAEDRIVPPRRLTRLPKRGENPGRVLDQVCGELVDNGFHVPQRTLSWNDESHADLHGVPRRSLVPRSILSSPVSTGQRRLRESRRKPFAGLGSWWDGKPHPVGHSQPAAMRRISVPWPWRSLRTSRA